MDHIALMNLGLLPRHKHFTAEPAGVLFLSFIPMNSVVRSHIFDTFPTLLALSPFDFCRDMRAGKGHWMSAEMLGEILRAVLISFRCVVANVAFPWLRLLLILTDNWRRWPCERGQLLCMHASNRNQHAQQFKCKYPHLTTGCSARNRRQADALPLSPRSGRRGHQWGSPRDSAPSPALDDLAVQAPHSKHLKARVFHWGSRRSVAALTSSRGPSWKLDWKLLVAARVKRNKLHSRFSFEWTLFLTSKCNWLLCTQVTTSIRAHNRLENPPAHTLQRPPL